MILPGAYGRTLSPFVTKPFCTGENSRDVFAGTFGATMKRKTRRREISVMQECVWGKTFFMMPPQFVLPFSGKEWVN